LSPEVLIDGVVKPVCRIAEPSCLPPDSRVVSDALFGS